MYVKIDDIVGNIKTKKVFWYFDYIRKHDKSRLKSRGEFAAAYYF